MIKRAVLVGFLLMGGCDSRTPTAPPVVQATPTPAATPAPLPSPVSTATPAPLKHDWWFRSDGSFCVTNHSGGTTSFQACARRVYPGGDQDFTSTDSIVPGGWIPDGDTFCGKLATFSCYTEMEIVEQPNTCNDFKQIVGARYLNVGQYCSRGPTPSPSPTTPGPTPTPTCISTPSFSEQSVVAGPVVSASATVSGAGSWVLSLYATDALSEYEVNQPDYVKGVTRMTTVCGTTNVMRVSYEWLGHSSRYWWADLYLGGVRVWKSAAVEH